MTLLVVESSFPSCAVSFLLYLLAESYSVGVKACSRDGVVNPRRLDQRANPVPTSFVIVFDLSNTGHARYLFRP
jgi:hypothetical protein